MKLLSPNVDESSSARRTLPKLSSAPASPISGQMYYDTTSNSVFFYNGSTWLDVMSMTWPALAPLGSVTAPSYSFTGDPNTGIWSSGADTLDFTTGGVDRIVITSTGQIQLPSATGPTTGLLLGGDVQLYRASAARAAFGVGDQLLVQAETGIGSANPSTNVLLRLNRVKADDGSTTQYGLLFDGTWQPTNDITASVNGAYFLAKLSDATATGNLSGGYFGIRGAGQVLAAGATPRTWGSVEGVRGSVLQDALGGTITNAYAVRGINTINATVTASFALYADTPSFGVSAAVATNYGVYVENQGASAVTTAIGLRLDSQTGAGTNWAIQAAGGQSYHVGNLRIGSTTAPTVALDVTGAVKVSTTLDVTGIMSALAGGKTALTLADSGAQLSGLTIGGDTNLYRSAADVLRTDGDLAIGSGATASPGGLGVYLRTAGPTWIGRPLLTDTALAFSASGNTQAPFFMLASGALSWGPGNAPVDLNLYRASAGVLKSDNRLWLGAASAGLSSTLSLLQMGLGERTLLIRRSTDSSPTGYFFDFQNNAGSGSMLAADVTGALTWQGDTDLYRSAANVLASDDQLRVVDGIITKAIAGTITDGGFTVAPTDGALAVDTTNTKLGFRSGGVWREVGEQSRVVATTVLDVGVSGQIHAGRAFVLTDFTTNLGLTAPVGLYNLGDTSDISGNARTLTNVGTVAFGSGVTGAATEAAIFTGANAKALHNTNAAFQIKTGSWGSWFRVAKRATAQFVLAKWRTSTANRGYAIEIGTDNVLRAYASTNGTLTTNAIGVTDVCDDHWHFVVGTHDGYITRIYVDGVLEGAVANFGTIFASAATFGIGAGDADQATTLEPFFGRIDEAFVTSDVLTLDQIRYLYAAKIAHGLALTPSDAELAVVRRRKGGPFATTDFPATPLHLYNFTAGALTDAGSLNTTLALVATPVTVAGADGVDSSSYRFAAASSQGLSGTDTGLPSGTASRSFGCWIRTTSTTPQIIAQYGTNASATSLFLSGASGPPRPLAFTADGVNSILGPSTYNDGTWHFVVGVADNGAVDGLKQKLYVDGKLVGTHTTLGSTTLLGAGGLRVASNSTPASFFDGDVDGFFILNVALTAEQVAKLYAVGSQASATAPKNAGDHIEGMDASNVYTIFDDMPSQNQVSLKVAA